MAVTYHVDPCPDAVVPFRAEADLRVVLVRVPCGVEEAAVDYWVPSVRCFPCAVKGVEADRVVHQVESCAHQDGAEHLADEVRLVGD